MRNYKHSEEIKLYLSETAWRRRETPEEREETNRKISAGVKRAIERKRKEGSNDR